MTSYEDSEITSTESEKINQSEIYGEYKIPEFCFGESYKYLTGLDVYPKWQKTPRSAADFSESKSSLSSCKDSDYDEWLKNYYNVLCKDQSVHALFDKEVDTSDLIEEPKNVLTSLFQPLEKDFWSLGTKYWGPKDTRRHWPVLRNRKQCDFLPSIHPYLNLRSRYGRYHFLLNSTAAVPEVEYRKYACRVFSKAVLSLETLDIQLQKIMLCDNLCNFKWFDYLTKKSVSKSLRRTLRKQNSLEKVYLENIGLGRLDGIALLCALSKTAGEVVKELYIWKMFAEGQNPLLLNELSKKGKLVLKKDPTRFFTGIHFLQILNKFSNLTHLSVNYAYLANRSGDALLCLRSVRIGCLKKLRLLCVKDERPLLTNPGYGFGGWKIADGVWRRVAEWCPDLRRESKNVPVNMPQYENVILFLSKSIPVSDVYLSSGIDFTFQIPWDIDSTLLELRNWYAPTLESLSLHLWHHRDLLDFVIRCKILDEFPNLINFEFIGVLENIETLEGFCCQLSKGNYKLKTLLFWVEEQYINEKKLNDTRKRVIEIHEKYKKTFLKIGIDADLQIYSI